MPDQDATRAETIERLDALLSQAGVWNHIHVANVLYLHGVRLAAQPPGAGDNPRAVVERHRRHVEQSPGIGAEVQTYALAVCDDILADLPVPASGGSMEPLRERLAYQFEDSANSTTPAFVRRKSSGPEPSAPAPCPVREAAERLRTALLAEQFISTELAEPYWHLKNALKQPCAGRTGAPRKEELDAFFKAWVAKPCSRCGGRRNYRMDGQLQVVCWDCANPRPAAPEREPLKEPSEAAIKAGERELMRQESNSYPPARAVVRLILKAAYAAERGPVAPPQARDE